MEHNLLSETAMMEQNLQFDALERDKIYDVKQPIQKSNLRHENSQDIIKLKT